MSSAPHPELVTTFRSMAEVVYRGAVVRGRAPRGVRRPCGWSTGGDHASLMVRRHGKVVTAAASDDVARASDEVEREVGRGPCLDVLDEYAPHQHICADLRDGCEWPELGRRLTAELGVHGLAGFRLRQDGTSSGPSTSSATPRARSPPPRSTRPRCSSPSRRSASRRCTAARRPRPCAGAWRATARSARPWAC